MPKKFTPQEDEFIRNNYLKLSANKMAAELNRSKFGVFNRLIILRLKVPKSIVKARVKKSQFKKGHVTFNKGLKLTEYMSPASIKASEKTRFKKGSIPHNSIEIGVIKIRRDKRGVPYKFIRVKEGFIPLHRHIWMEANQRPIKEGFNVIFCDGNTMNLAIENLKIVSNAELALMNSIHNLPSDLIEIIRLQNRLNKKIKNIENGKK